eukprot:11197537-Lingulodinium_polyedra.AAC.1
MVSAWCVRRAQNVSRCGGGQRLQPHHCAAFAKRCTMMWLNRPFAAPAVRRARASRTPCGHHFRCPHGVRDARFASRCGGE